MSFNESYLRQDVGRHSLKKPELLHEPVPFEDFKFSLSEDFNIIQDRVIFEPQSNVNAVLDENDQKQFESFLEAFCSESNIQPEPAYDRSFCFSGENQFERSNYSFDHQPKTSMTSPPLPPPFAKYPENSTSASSSSEGSHTPQSIYLKSSDFISSPYTYHQTRPKTLPALPPPPMNEGLPSKKRYRSVREPMPTATSAKKAKNRVLLTEEEKRANHIASEQKRRGTIRTGFKELTDLVPTLKNVNNSKSTVLFKAADFIHSLNKKIKRLEDKVKSLKLRVDVEKSSHENQEVKEQDNPSIKALPADTRNLLLAYQSQQKQLELLQEQLQMHQHFISKQRETKHPLLT